MQRIFPAIKTKVGILEETSLYHENGYYETVDLLAAHMEALNQINRPRLQNGGEIIDFEVLEIAAYDTVFLRHTRDATALLPLETLKEISE